MGVRILNAKRKKYLFRSLYTEKKTKSKDLVFFQLNPPLAEEIYLRWMKSLCDEIRLTAGYEGGFNFI